MFSTAALVAFSLLVFAVLAFAGAYSVFKSYRDAKKWPR